MTISIACDVNVYKKGVNLHIVLCRPTFLIMKRMNLVFGYHGNEYGDFKCFALVND